MNSGFVTPKRVIKRVGIHQRFDTAAYKMIQRFITEKSFPELRDIIFFEGYNGPDGLKVKSPGVNEPSHLYDPVNDVGEVPVHIVNHYHGLVDALKRGDKIRGAFEASWLAHYVCDGLTPAHHWPLEDKIAEAVAAQDIKDGDTSTFGPIFKKYWALWGVKGHLSTHFYFETGIAFALMTYQVRGVFSEQELAHARELGPLEYFKEQAREISDLNLYERFYTESWSADLMAAVKNQVAPSTARAIGIIWLLALLEAGEQLAIGGDAADPTS